MLFVEDATYVPNGIGDSHLFSFLVSPIPASFLPESRKEAFNNIAFWTSPHFRTSSSIPLLLRAPTPRRNHRRQSPRRCKIRKRQSLNNKRRHECNMPPNQQHQRQSHNHIQPGIQRRSNPLRKCRKEKYLQKVRTSGNAPRKPDAFPGKWRGGRSKHSQSLATRRKIVIQST